MSDNVGSFRNAVLTEPLITAGSTPGIMRTPLAMGSQLPPSLPPLPPTIGLGGNALGQANSFGYNSNPYMGGMGYGGGGYGGSGFGFGGSGFGGFGSGFGGGYGGYGSSFGRFGLAPGDPEQRFIQLAENSSRGAIQSIESVVAAIGNIASMLDSTFFALTSSFRAILGVAANFGRLRTVFAQFWHTFAIFRGLNWIYRKMLYWLRLSKLDPSSIAFKEAFAAAVAAQSGNAGPALPRKGPSPWPVVAFISFIFTAPYLIMKLVGTVTDTALEETRNPAKWVNPIETSASYDFQARNTSELSFQTGQRVVVAPKEIQNTHRLLNTGWGLATIDGQTSGLVPITYLKSPSQMRQQLVNPKIENNLPATMEPMEPIQPQLPGLGVSDFAIAPQPIGGGSDFTNRTIPITTESRVGEEISTKEL